MTDTPHITDAAIRSKVTEQSYDRNVEYYRSGTVERAMLRGSRLFSAVQGSEWDPYQVGVTFTDNDFTASCTCPYDWGGYCKHVVATVLYAVDDDTHVTIAVKPPVADLVAEMGVASLRALVCQLVGADPALAEIVDAFSEGGLT